MRGAVSTYAEFSNPERAAQAVRALKAAGFRDIITEDLSHALIATIDAAESPARKSIRYAMIGLMLGAIAGCGLGFLIFALPVWVFTVSFGSVIALVGVVVCSVVGAVVGFQEAYLIFGRSLRALTSVVGGHPVGVQVTSEDGGPRLIRAREVLSLYSEDISFREKRWWQLRRWANSLGT